MIEFLKGLELYLIAFILFLTLSVVNFLMVLFRGKAKGYFMVSAVNLDRFGNSEFRTLFNLTLKKKNGYEFGNFQETISSVLGKNERDGTLSKTGKVLVWILNKIDKNHCQKSIKEFEMITERNVINGVISVFMVELVEFLYPLRWICLLAFIFILVDLRFGILSAKKRGEKVRFSRAIRRTMNKIVDYICWLLLAAAFGQVFGEPFKIATIREILLIVIFGVELNSCFGNYFDYRGINMKINIFKFLGKKTDIIEMEEKPENENKD